MFLPTRASEGLLKLEETPAAPNAARKATLVERRKNLELRKRIEEMSPEEMRQELLNNHMPDLESALGFDRDIQDHPGRVPAIDMDGLGFVKDNFGHEFADGFIKAFGETISWAAREAGLQGWEHRKGGDEFAVLVGSEAQANDLVEILRKALEEPLTGLYKDWVTWELGPCSSAGLGRTWEEPDGRL